MAQKFDRFQILRNNSNNMQQRVHTDATCNIQQCWELLANNVASVSMGLYAIYYQALTWQVLDAFGLNNRDGDDMIEHVNYCTSVKAR